MFFIFGLDDAKPYIVTSQQSKYCYHCHNTTYWNIVKHQTRFSLFFLPILPIKSKYYFLCPICNHGDEITQSEYTNLINESTTK